MNKSKSLKVLVRVACLFVLLAGDLEAVDLTRFNLQHQYNPFHGFQLDHHTVDDGDTVAVQIKLSLSPQQKFDNLAINYLTQRAYNSKDHVLISDQISISELNTKLRLKYYNARIPKAILDSILVIEVFDLQTEMSYFYDVDVSVVENFPISDIKVSNSQDLPWVETYALTTDSLTFASTEERVYGYYYSYEFPVAAPPMSKDKNGRLGKFKIDSTFSIPTNQPIAFTRPGLYLLQSDTNSVIGRPIFVADPSFPKYRDVYNLAYCLKYLTTKDEYEKLMRNPTKTNFDRLWLELAGSSGNARTLIRRYYSRIEESNQFFTSYKEGWKTDLGIIYTIFGTPDEVLKDQNYQQWIYESTEVRAKMVFNFKKVKDLFSREHYELMRKDIYASLWFQSIEGWRTGR